MRKEVAAVILAAVISMTGCISRAVVDSGSGAAPAAEGKQATQENIQPFPTETSENIADNNTMIDSNFHEPPMLSLLANGVSFSLRTGNYSWSISDGELTTETIACGASPVQSVEQGSAVIIPAESTPQISLPEGAEIAEAWVWQSDESKAPAEFTEDGRIVLGSGEGRVYSVTVEFQQGRAEYVFATDSIEPMCGLPSSEDTLYGGDDLYKPAARIYRTDGYIDDRSYPFTVTITSAEQLGQYIEDNSELYQIKGDMFTDYDSGYFERSALVLAVLEEGSGSVSHEFIGIDRDYTIHIRRNVPEVGTCDMAEYHVVIEISSALAEAEFSVALETIAE